MTDVYTSSMEENKNIDIKASNKFKSKADTYRNPKKSVSSVNLV